MHASLFLLRHGAVDSQGKMIGALDLPLSAEATIQLARTRLFLNEFSFSHVVCSPLLRCRQTAALLGMDSQEYIWDELREINFGCWEGQSFSEVARRSPDQVAQLARWDKDFCFPEGESIQHFLQRIEDIKIKLATLGSGNILVITHGGVIRQLLCNYLGIAPEKYLLFDIQTGKYTRIAVHSEGGVLMSFNTGGA